ncbi:MAG: chromate efflux transporter [Acholeplasmataceae bacterium]|nr:MAG: chromate efflux transporter [Acholeplasmataceae bacterium]
MQDVYPKVHRLSFLKDVLICSLGAYGGPEAHYGVFTDQMVVKKQYLTEEELVELIALTGVLPGPSSTQTIIAIGYKIGGPVLAILTFLVWAMPAILIMTALSFMYVFLSRINLDADGLRYIAPMAVGFIAVAAFRIGRKVIKNTMTALLFVLGAVVTYLIRSAWVFPVVLLAGGVIAVLSTKEKQLWQRSRIRPSWLYLALFAGIAIGTILLVQWFDHRLLTLFDRFYRFGYLVIGGGQVVIPYMYTDLVHVQGYMTTQEFLTGFGIVQGIPGPMFSFSAYAGGLASRSGGVLMQILGALAAATGIFLPGILLIFFVYPIWESLKQIKGIRVSLSGITAVAGGLIAIAAVILMTASGFSFDNILVLLVTVGLLVTKKIPAPFIVLLTLLAGFLL